VAEIEADLATNNIALIYVLEQDQSFTDGTATLCRDYMDGRGSTGGICVGDAQTQPTAGAWDDSPLAIGRGFDIVVERATMRILYQTTHGTPAGNENLTAEELLSEILGAIP
jgi:hypothetical protein